VKETGNRGGENMGEWVNDKKSGLQHYFRARVGVKSRGTEGEHSVC